MNVMQNAIISNRHKTEHPDWSGHRWKSFRANALNKKIFVFGGGTACDYFFSRYGAKYNDQYQVCAILDNDKAKWGDHYQNYNQDLIIENPGILTGMENQSIIVLIASTNYYAEMARQLEAMDIYDYYILCIMEASRRTMKIVVWFYRQHRYLLKKYRTQKDIFRKILWYYLYRRYPVEPAKILFSAFGKYDGHEKYITEALIQRKSPVEIVWLVNDIEVKLPPGIRKIARSDVKAVIREMCTAGIWVSNCPFEYSARKRSGQYYIQCKHWSSVTLKKFYLDAPTIQKLRVNVRTWKHNGRLMDFIITGSWFDTESCLRGFRPRGECVELGSPRSDVLFLEHLPFKERICKKYNIPVTSRLILYAPTYRFRKDSQENIHVLPEDSLDYQQLLNTLRMKFGGEWYGLVRFHPSLEKKSGSLVLRENWINVSGYDDVQELVAAAEVMISDYSSIMFEPSFVRKPVFIYATDIDSYMADEYDFLLDIHSLPFPLAENSEELFENILTFSRQQYEERVEKFLRYYGVHEDGKASQRAAAFICKLIGVG